MSHAWDDGQLQQSGQLFRGEVAVAQDLNCEPGADGFTGMNGNNRGTAIGMTQEVMAAFSADDDEACPTKGGNEDSPGQSREFGHYATRTR